MELRLSYSAVSDLEDIKLYYTEEGVPDVGIRFVKDILVHIEALLGHPKIGRIVPEFEDESIREILHNPFRIVYLLEKNLINVVRIWRSERVLALPANET